MIRRALAAFTALLCLVLVAAGPTIVVTGQMLAYQDGYVFFTTGDGFRVAPGVVIHDAATGGATAIVPGPRVFARATFDASGTVIELDLSRKPLPVQGSFDQVGRFAVALSSPVPNPDLVVPTTTDRNRPQTRGFSGRPVLVTFTVQVPANTPLSASVYITTDQSGWNAQAIPMDRIDGLHYQITRRLNSGTVFRYIYDRGSFQSQETSQNGLQRTPRQVIVGDADVRTIRDTVYAWADTAAGNLNAVPNGMPTPYNPNPFVNLPNGFPTPHPPHR